MPGVKAHDADLAARLVDEAGRILASEGIAALTLRRLAARSGTSTMAVYTLFGDKPGLLAAMYREGFARLGAAIDAARARGGDALAALAELGLAYRAAAQANPHLYALMFGAAVPGFSPDEESRRAADATFQPVVDAVARCLDEGVLVGASAERIALFLWAVSHGVMSLELAGQLKEPPDAPVDAETVYRDALVFSVVPFLPR